MRHNDVIYLISVQLTQDEWGNWIEEEEERMVFANEFSVSTKEFYDASLAGLKPSKTWEIYSFEYNGETKLRHEEDVYKVMHTVKKGDKLRLVVERVAGDG